MYRLSEEQQRIVGQVAAVADQSIAPNAAHVDRERAFPAESIAGLAKAGLLGLTVPAAFGGMGQGLGTMAAALDEVAQRCASTAMVYLMHLCGVACYAAASDKSAALAAGGGARRASQHAGVQRARLAQPFLGAGQPGAAANGGVTLSAQKSFVTSAGQADGYVVSTLAAGCRAADRDARSTWCCATIAGVTRRPAPGRAWACAATPARR